MTHVDGADEMQVRNSRAAIFEMALLPRLRTSF
jgi:hypothetical protein